MTIHEFDRRMVQEEKQFLEMCIAAGVWDRLEAGRVSPILARAFAERLILDLSVEATRARIQSDPAGAAAVAEVVQALIHDRRNRMHIAASIPTEKLTPFYVMGAIVADLKAGELEEFEALSAAEFDGDSSKDL
jgi:hypothetical protein